MGAQKDPSFELQEADFGQQKCSAKRKGKLTTVSNHPLSPPAIDSCRRKEDVLASHRFPFVGVEALTYY